MATRGNGQRIRRREARARRLHALVRLETAWENADPEEAELIAEEADELALRVRPYSKLPKQAAYHG